jgi:putative transposase
MRLCDGRVREIVNIGGAKVIRSNGIEMERDENSARRIFLRALVDSLILSEGAR